MGPVVEPGDTVPLERPVLADHGTGLLHLGQYLAIHLHGAGPVEDDVHGHPGPGALREGIGELLPDLAGPVYVGVEGDGDRRSPDCFQHGREDLVAVVKRRHTVPRREGRTQHHRQLAPELVGPGSISVADLPGQPLARRRPVAHEATRSGTRWGPSRWRFRAIQAKENAAIPRKIPACVRSPKMRRPTPKSVA